MTEKQIKTGLYVSIAITGLLVLGFIGETLGIWGGTGGGTSSRSGNIYMMCDSTGDSYELSRDEFRKLMQEKSPEGMMGPMMGPMGGGMMAYKCQICGQDDAFIAQKCQKCGEVFTMDYQITDDYPDRCPACDYSRIEEMRNKR